MSLILVVEREARHIERIEDALTSEGWRVKTVADRQEAAAAAAEEAPELVLVSSSQPDSRQILESFGRKGGGPGSIVLLAESEVGMPSAESLGADDLVSKPFTAKELRMVVRRCLAGSTAPTAATGSASEDKLTSSDIFGDLLDEVEGRPPTLVPPPPAADADIDRKIEETLSGILGPSHERSSGRTTAARQSSAAKRASKAKAGASAVDRLLNDTLSGLDLGGKKKSRRSTEPPAISDASEPLVEPVLTPLPPPSLEPEIQAPAAADLESEVPAEPVPPDLATSADAKRLPDTEADDAAATSKATQREVAQEAPPAAPSLPSVPLRTKGEFLEPLEDLEGIDSLYATQRIPITKGEDVDEEPAAGEEFGQYTLEERIARGGMAEVWRAKMKGVEGFQKQVAIKRILPHLTDSGDFVEMFIDEAKLAAQLNHSNIIHIYDLGKIGDDYYIAMEYVDGKDLRSILNRARAVERPMPHALALLIASRLAGALDYAHRKRDFDNRELGLVHRDVSPQNVLISKEGDIKLCDFGIAKAVSKVSKTQMGALKGKLQYMSPEQARGKKVDARTDIFSLGAVLFEMLTGRRLFPGDSEISVLEAVREGRIVEPREIDAAIPSEVNACVVKALAKDPNDRYQTAGELESELSRLLQQVKPGTGASDLARYVQDVFSVESLKRGQVEETAVGENEKEAGEDKDGEQQEFPPLAPPAGTTSEEGEGRGRGVLLAAIAALVILVVAAVFVVRYRIKQGQPTLPAVAETAGQASSPAGASQGQGGAATPTPVASQTPEAGAAQRAAKPASSGATAPVVGRNEAGSVKSLASASPRSQEVQKLVSEELQRREDALRKKFEEQQKKLQEELAKTQAKQRQSKAAAEPSPASSAAKKATGEKQSPSPAEGKTKTATAAKMGAAGETGATAAAHSAAPGEKEPALPKSSPMPAKTSIAPSSAVGTTATEPPTTAASQSQTTETAPIQVAATSSPPPKPAVTLGELVPMGPGVIPPVLTSFVKPSYPPIAQRFRVQGTVILSLLVDENGRVQKVRLLRGVAEKVGLNEAAIAAAKKARFKPAIKDGIRVKMWFTLTVPFQL